jgi:hypothetical protein
MLLRRGHELVLEVPNASIIVVVIPPENPFPMAFSEGEWPPLFDDQVQLTLWRLRQQP